MRSELDLVGGASLREFVLKLETLNIWRGRVYQPLMEHMRKQAQMVDIFCLQEVYSTQSGRISTREIAVSGPDESCQLP